MKSLTTKRDKTYENQRSADYKADIISFSFLLNRNIARDYLSLIISLTISAYLLLIISVIGILRFIVLTTFANKGAILTSLYQG